MKNLRPGPWLTCALLVAACSSSSKPSPDSGGPGKDAGEDAKDAAAAADAPPPPDLAQEAIADMPVETPSDSPIGPEVGIDGISTEGEAGTEAGPVDGASTCYWQLVGGRYQLPHFTFQLTTPDGQSQSPPRPERAGMDAGTLWPINDFEGRVVGASGNQLTVDSCLTQNDCPASLYRFTLCNQMWGKSCQAQTGPGAIEVGIPVGRRVRVVWRMESFNYFDPGLYWLAVYDAEPGTSQGSLLFVGSGGHQALPVADMPFTTQLEHLPCGLEPFAPTPVSWGDFAFVFTAKDDAGRSLRIATGEDGFLEVPTPAGGSQRLHLHCIDAVQPDHTDDYWNWDFWGTGETVTIPVDAGSGG